MLVHTACWHASAQESSADTPQTVTQVLGVMSLASPPILRISLFVAQTRSQIKSGSVPEYSSDASRLFFLLRCFLAFDLLLARAATDTAETATPTAPSNKGDINGMLRTRIRLDASVCLHELTRAFQVYFLVIILANSW